MPQSLAKVIVHIVYSTKHRKPWLNDPGLRSELYGCSRTNFGRCAEGMESRLMNDMFGIENGAGALIRAAPLGLFGL